MPARSYKLTISLCLLIVISGLFGSIISGTPGQDGALAAVFPPWWSAARVFSAAAKAGDILDSGAVPFIPIVKSPKPGLGARLHAAGALLLLNPLDAGGCGRPAIGTPDV